MSPQQKNAKKASLGKRFQALLRGDKNIIPVSSQVRAQNQIQNLRVCRCGQVVRAGQRCLCIDHQA